MSDDQVDDGRVSAAPSFPWKTTLAGGALMLLVALVSVSTAWFVGDRLRTMTKVQLAVVTGAVTIQSRNDQLESVVRLAIGTKEPIYLREYQKLEPQLRAEMRQLQAAIQLPENRVTFARISRAKRAKSDVEYQAMALIAAGRTDLAKPLLKGEEYQVHGRIYRDGLNRIEHRAREFVESSSREADRYLNINLLISVIGLCLLALAAAVVLRPARHWARQINEASKEAQSAARAKSEFLATMSHEIRTPLNGIIGFSDILLGDDSLPASQKRQVELIQSAGTALLSVINDVLEYSKIEAGGLELIIQPFPIAALADNSVSIMRPAVDAKALILQATLDPKINRFYAGDESRIRQVLLNLLNNAVKFTSAGTVRLDVTCSNHTVHGDMIRFAVTDSGSGIEPALKARLFKPFSQADASITRRYGGTGLGLSISKRLVDLMQGEIGFTSEPGVGSTFWFTVPLQRASEPMKIEPSSKSLSLRGARVLLVEDLEVNQELGQILLKRMGCEVDVASDGQQAVSAASAGDYDLILMDIQMPTMDGITATRLIRDLPSARGNVPIIAMTANVFPEQVTEYRKAGMVAHVAKPVKQADLQNVMNSVLAAARLREGSVSERKPTVNIFDDNQIATVRGMLAPERLDRHIETLRMDVTELAGSCLPNTIQAQAHKVASQAAMLGLSRLSAKARTLENVCEAGGNVEASIRECMDCIADIADYPTAAARQRA